jgi:ribosomal protein S18 acetylase RimI-like enzyme
VRNQDSTGPTAAGKGEAREPRESSPDPAAFHLHLAAPEDAPAIAALRTAVAEDLTRRYGKGHWSSVASERGVLAAMRSSQVFLARAGSAVIATLRLGTKKPWAIDTSYFTPCKTPLYLTDMAVAPERQRQGIGRLCVAEMRRIAMARMTRPADAIRLDAYDAAAGAGGFYHQCGFREVGRVVYRGTPLIYFEMLARPGARSPAT